MNWDFFNFCGLGNVDMVKLLLDNRADVHADDNWALRWASSNGRYEVVKLLLDNGADIHADNNWALIYASDNGHYKVVELLKQYRSKNVLRNK